MEEEDVLMAALMELPSRVRKLETTVGEQQLLLSLLLGHSGLDEKRTLAAFDWAHEAWEGIKQSLMEKTRAEWESTPEGQEQLRVWAEKQRQFDAKFWREDCLEDGQIRPFPADRDEKGTPLAPRMNLKDKKSLIGT